MMLINGLENTVLIKMDFGYPMQNLTLTLFVMMFNVAIENLMNVKLKRLQFNLVFGEYSGQLCTLVEEFHSKQFGASLRLRAADGREFRC